ncbi:hypothetical protein BDV41DRAFT_580696 [Aspergillus transmontanensis]|uniref:F-box domain-containing protein n=1 Tax=Aspergillus transmontanensis TaxID=1034304 RepID=A0A5N6VL43_9EURO|nr:hypothetical protein BDV41DRAFT_580696 [Aspergillus transmontanensis]
MVNFADILPTECTTAILSFLQQHDLLVAMRVCRAWHQVTEPLFYQNLQPQTATSMASLLRTLESRPDLIPVIHHLFVTFENDEIIPGHQAYLLRRLSNLYSLHLPRWPQDGKLGYFLPSLRQVVLGYKSPMDELRLLWSFPSIESIEACLDDPICTPDIWPTTKTLTKLKLNRSSISEESLAIILQASPSLKSLHYDHQCNVAGEKAWHDGNRLRGALYHIRDTLEYLEIRMGLYSPYAEELIYLNLIPVQNHIGSLKDFQNLRSLVIPIAALFGWNVELDHDLTDVFPASLTHLSLVEDLVMQCTYEWSEQLVLERLGTFLAQMAPQLELFEFRPDHIFERWTEELEGSLRVLCLRDGVRCIIHQDEDVDEDSDEDP